jgi:hypothetical protein
MKLTAAMQKQRADGATYQAIADSLGVAKSTVQKAFGAHPDATGRRAKAAHKVPVSADSKRTGRSLSEFRQAYDKDFIVPGRIKAALRVLAGGCEYEVAFANLAGVSLADLGNYRDQFADHVVTLRESRRAWAGTVATAKTMKGML